MPDEPLVHRFMRFTGRLRMIFGAAQSSPLDHEMTESNKELLARQQAAAEQWTAVKRADGTTYLVPKDPNDQSLR